MWKLKIKKRNDRNNKRWWF